MTRRLDLAAQASSTSEPSSGGRSLQSSEPPSGYRTVAVSRLDLARRTALLAARLAPDERQAVLLWAVLIGLLGAAAGLAFSGAVDGVKWLLTGRTGSVAEVARHLEWWQRLVMPPVGAAVAGLVLAAGDRFAGGRRGADYLEAIAVGDGVVRWRPTLLRTASSFATVTSGGSVGREGPIVQLGALVASLAGRWRGVPTPRLRLLVACGAAAGVASAYGTPIGAALFVAEVLLGAVAMQSFGPLLLASVVSALVTQQVTGAEPRFDVPTFRIVSIWEAFPYLALGLVGGVAGPWFLYVLKAVRRLFDRIPGPRVVRFVLGGLGVGLLAIVVPEAWGSGLDTETSVLYTEWLWQSLALVLVVKVAAVAVTTGSGAVGGIFAPTLFVGGILGALLGTLFHVLAPTLTAGPTAYALVGMGVFLSATTHAPLTAIVMVFEMTLDYSIVPPLMVACVTAVYTAQSLEPENVYTASLTRQRRQLGTDVSIPDLRVRDLLRTAPATLSPDAPFEAVVVTFMREPYKYAYVTDADARFLGAIALHDVKPYLRDDGTLGDLVRAADLVRKDFPVVAEGDTLLEALERFAGHDGERVPVVADRESRRLVGIVVKTDILLTLSQGAKPVL